MPQIFIETIINAPIERVFDLARSIDLHTNSLAQTNETAVAGKTKGLINIGETVTWEAIHFGIKQKLTSKITQFDYPKHFRDSMIKGAFARFDHDHFFEELDGKTLMHDVFDYDSPLGIIGKAADFLFLEDYMRNLLIARNQIIKNVAESNDWKKFLD
jgi:ligand-binding SRPBCC domain-containing protein